MTDRSETALQHSIIVALEQMGVWVIRTAVSSKHSRGLTGEPGLPDLCLPAWGWLEVKLPGRELDPAQVSWHRRANALGIHTGTVHSVSEAMAYLKQWGSTKLK